MPTADHEQTGAVMREAEDQHRFASEPFRDYLRLLARLWLPRRLQPKLDASDLVQNAILKAHAKGDQFGGSTDGQYKAWLRQIVRNTLLDELKKRQLPEQSVRGVEDASRWTDNWLAANGPSAGSQVANEELLELLARTLAKLPEDWQEVLRLHYLAGFRVEQMGPGGPRDAAGRESNLPVGAKESGVLRSIFRCLSSLR